jgi:hypothetical protein
MKSEKSKAIFLFLRMLHEEHLYSIALRATPNIGDINFMRLIDAAGSAKEAWLFLKNC